MKITLPKDQWILFSEKLRTDPGEYWIYRKVEKGPYSRIILMTLYKKYGWAINASASFIPDKPNWTHWIKIEKPKPPKDRT